MGGWKTMLLALSRDKADTLLLLFAALLVLAPHAAHLPAWISLLCATTLLWRGVVTFRGTRMPPAWLLLPLSLAAMGGVFATFHTLLGRDAGVAMLVLLVAFKMLEMHARRDLFVVIYLCFFLVLTNFFYAQGIGSALLMVGAILALLSAQVSFQFTGTVPPLRTRVRIAATILALAAPLAALLFVGFPRIEGPLWGMPSDAVSGRTGLSDSMAPGNLSSLAQSDEVAFRVRFLDPAPGQAQLYWRGIVLADFDGRAWTQLRHGRADAARTAAIRVSGARVRHEVTLEASPQRWLFALDVPESLPRVAGNPATMTPEVELSASHALNTRVRYLAASYPNYTLDAQAPPADIARWLALPDGFNPRAMAAGQALRREADPIARVRAVLQQFHSQNFVYTLEPPALGHDSVDQFLYTTRAGFCEHYSSAFVFLMRAAGVPARVIMGYQGGELNPVDGYLTVRQSDAHAWAEVWVAGRGWLRIDPTGAVAPERIRRGGVHAQARKNPFGLPQLGSLMGFGGDGTGWLAQLRFRIGALNNGWNQWVLNYTPERQRGLIETLAEALGRWSVLGAIGALLALLYLGFTLRRRAETDPVDALYSALSQQLARAGLARRPDEGPNAYAERLARSRLPTKAMGAAARFLQLYSAYKYAAAAPHARRAATVKELHHLLNEIP